MKLLVVIPEQADTLVLQCREGDAVGAEVGEHDLRRLDLPRDLIPVTRWGPELEVGVGALTGLGE